MIMITKVEHCSYVVVLPYGTDDGDEAVEGHEHNAVRRRRQKTEERQSGEPHAARELIVGAVAGHASAVHNNERRQQRQERRTQVYDALVHDQNVHRLKTKEYSYASFGSRRRPAVVNYRLSYSRHHLTVTALPAEYVRAPFGPFRSPFVELFIGSSPRSNIVF